jgi:threonine/homoserine/homoserine lactone efflux protein
MSLYQLGLLIVFASSLLGSPGPAVVSLAASGAAVGYRRSMPFLGGIITRFLVNLLAVAFGLAAVFANSPTVHTWFKFVSAAYIMYLAWKIGSSGPIEEGKSSPFGYPQGVLLNLLNPKA